MSNGVFMTREIQEKLSRDLKKVGTYVPTPVLFLIS